MPQQIEAAFVETALYAAGRTLMALPATGTRPAGFRSGMPEFLRDVEDLKHAETHYRVPVPPPAAISAMEQALSWISLLPGITDLEIKIRRLVCARCLISPRTDRNLYSWKRLGDVFGCSDKTAKTRWIDAVATITAALNRPGLCAVSGGPAPDPIKWTRRPSRISLSDAAKLVAV